MWDVKNTTEDGLSVSAATWSPDGTSSDDGLSVYTENVPIYISFYLLIILIIVGLICNSLSIGVFVTSVTLRHTTTGHYLVALAVADTLYLVGELFRWMNTSTYDNKLIVPFRLAQRWNFSCTAIYFVRYAFKFMSAWITVIITAERFITVTFPLKVTSISTLVTARFTIAVTTLLSIGLNLYPFFYIGVKGSVGHEYCAIINKDKYDAWSMIVLRVGQLIIPSILIFIFTGLIIYFVMQARSKRQLHLSASTRSCSETSHHKRSVETQLTIMLIAVAVASLVFRLPYMIAYYLNLNKADIWPGSDKWISYRTRFATEMTHVIAVLNYVMNFFLYCLCGSTFRTQLVHWLPFCRRVVPHDSRFSCGTNASNKKQMATTMTNANSCGSMSTATKL